MHGVRPAYLWCACPHLKSSAGKATWLYSCTWRPTAAALLFVAAGDPLLVLPAFHLPFVTVSFGISTKMPGGRSPLFHHAFPVLSAPPGPDAPPQEVVDVFSLMKCEGWSLAIDIAVNSERSHSVGSIVTPGSSRPGGHAAAAAAGLGSGSGGAAGPSGVAAACWHYFQPYNLPHAFIGEFQIKYIIDMVDTLINPTAVVRLSRKLKPFYARDRRPEAAAAAKAVAAVRAQILPMPMLKQQVEISLTADVFRVHHDAQDSEDPSDMVYIALSRYCCAVGRCGGWGCDSAVGGYCAGQRLGRTCSLECIQAVLGSACGQRHNFLTSVAACN